MHPAFQEQRASAPFQKAGANSSPDFPRSRENIDNFRIGTEVSNVAEAVLTDPQCFPVDLDLSSSSSTRKKDSRYVEEELVSFDELPVHLDTVPLALETTSRGWQFSRSAMECVLASQVEPILDTGLVITPFNGVNAGQPSNETTPSIEQIHPASSLELSASDLAPKTTSSRRENLSYSFTGLPSPLYSESQMAPLLPETDSLLPPMDEAVESGFRSSESYQCSQSERRASSNSFEISNAWYAESHPPTCEFPLQPIFFPCRKNDVVHTTSTFKRSGATKEMTIDEVGSACRKPSDEEDHLREGYILSNPAQKSSVISAGNDAPPHHPSAVFATLDSCNERQSYVNFNSQRPADGQVPRNARTGTEYGRTESNALDSKYGADILSPIASEKDARCDICHKLYRGKVNLRRHVHRAHRGLPKQKQIKRKCNICHEEMLFTNLKAHIRVVHDKPSKYRCVECSSAGFSSKRAHSRHMRMVHGSRGGMKCRTKRVYAPCSVSGCPHVANSWGNIQRHMEIVHYKRKRFLCEHCGTLFGTKSNMEVHKCI